MREVISDWLMLLGAPILLGSLFLAWSHQFSAGFIARYAHPPALTGIPRDPTAWQVYSVVDVLLAVLAGGVLAVALRGARPARIAVLLGLLVALAFTLHALSAPPTNGATLSEAGLGYVPESPGTGLGEPLALVALGLGLGGLALSFTVD